MSDLAARLAELDQEGLRRRRRIVQGAQGAHLTVDGRRYLSFCSNDYLGLAGHPALIEAAQEGARRYGVGAGASHLISGHMTAHEELEHALAQFVMQPRALYFATGYMANLGVIPALVGRGDAVFSDQLNHACLIDATRLSRADVHVYPHLDLDVLDRNLASCRSPRKLVATDAVFSMDGDIAPLPRLLEICERRDAWLLIDDAHGLGVLGPQGRGTAAHFGLRSPKLIYMGTLGKAAGVAGAFVAGHADLIEWLVQRARTYIFTTGSPPMLATALVASLRLIETEHWRRERLTELVRRLRDGLGRLRHRAVAASLAHGTTRRTPATDADILAPQTIVADGGDQPLRLLDSDTAIQPLIVGDNAAAVELSERLLAAGIWVPAIRPPTVPHGTARLRISLSAAHSVEDVDRLVQELHAQ
jgi:8-amino-7-oxononanoate synthase